MDGKVGRLGGRKSAFKGGMRAVAAHKVWLMKILGVLFFQRVAKVGGSCSFAAAIYLRVRVCGGVCEVVLVSVCVCDCTWL